MSIEAQKFYPGETATARQILLLANEYHRAADLLLGSGRRGEPLSRAPFRLMAIHAIELYLNALLRAFGCPATKLSGMHHNFAVRAEFALSIKLNLRKRTLTHLHSLSEAREYLITRYDPGASAVSELNRLVATLNEVAEKVTSIIDRAVE